VTFNDQEMKFLRLALDPGAHEGEIDNATAKLIQSLRVRLAKPEDFESAKFTPGREAPRQEQSKQTSGVNWGETKFNFGKMRGQAIQDATPDYLLWCYDWINNNEDEDLKNRYKNVALAIGKYLNL
jgi:hypothetical protein